MALGDDLDCVGDLFSGLVVVLSPEAVSTVNRRSYSALRDIIVVISLTVIRLTSSPSIAMMRSPGDIRSTRTLEVRTPETTVPFESALFARMIPSFPGGATMVVLDRRTTEEVVLVFLLVALEDLRPERPEVLDVPPKLMPLETPAVGNPLASLLLPTMANCISKRNKSLATLRLCSDICDKKDLVERWEYLLARLPWLSTLRSERCLLAPVLRDLRRAPATEDDRCDLPP